MLAKLRSKVPFGIGRALHKARAMILPSEVYSFQLIRRYCQGQGLEIGPGKYPYCDPRRTTFLEKHPDASDGMRRPHIVGDGGRIPKPDAAFDFVFASHVLEHMPDAIGVLKEWMRVIRPGGVLFLILPHADRTFDRHREKTKLSHHIKDHEKLLAQPDHSHDGEAREGWSKLEDFDDHVRAHRAAFGTDFFDFDHRLASDAMHYHVWTQDEIVRLLQHLGTRIVAVADQIADRGDSFVVVATRPREADQ